MKLNKGPVKEEEKPSDLIEKQKEEIEALVKRFNKAKGIKDEFQSVTQVFQAGVIEL